MSNELTIISPVDVFGVIEGMDLDTLQNTYAELPDIETKDGYEFIKNGLKEVKGYKKIVEEIRESHKRPILDAGIALDAEAKRIKTILTSIIDPMAAAKKEIDGRKKREKEQLEAMLESKIETIKNFVALAVNKPSETIGEYISEVGETDTTHGFYHRSGEAGIARAETLDKLTDMLNSAIEQEQSAQRLKELEEAEAKRLANEINDLHTLAIAENIVFDRDREIEFKKQEEIRLAEEKAEAKRKEEAAKLKAENDKRIADEAKEQARLHAIEVAKKAEIDKQNAVKAATKEAERKAKEAAEKAERDRLAETERQRKEDERRAANKAHRKNVMGKVKVSLMNFCEDEDMAIKITKALAKGEIECAKVIF